MKTNKFQHRLILRKQLIFLINTRIHQPIKEINQKKKSGGIKKWKKKKGYVHMEIDGDENTVVLSGLSDGTILVLCAVHVIRLSRFANVPIEQIHRLIDTLDEDCIIVEEDVE